MTRFDGLRHAYDYDYPGCIGCHRRSAAWDTRTFVGDGGGWDGDETDYYSGTIFGGRPPASVIGYGGDLPFRPRSRRPSMAVAGAAAAGAAAAPANGRRKTLRPSLPTGPEKESLKQRLTLDKSFTGPAPTPFFGGGSDEHVPGCPRRAHYHNHHHHYRQPYPRARSLSLSRLSDGMSDSSPGYDNDGSEDGDVGDDATVANHWDGHMRRTPRRVPSFGASRVRRHPRIPVLGEWHGERFRARPRSEDRALDVDLEMDGLRDAYERGYHFFSDDGRHSIHEDDLRLRLGGGERMPNPRVPRRRRDSFEILGEGSRRKEVSPGTRTRMNT